MSPDPGRGVAMALFAAMLWGTTGTAQALLATALPPVWFGALRLAMAAAFFALVAAVVARRSGARSRPLPRFALAVAGACMAVYNLAFFAGIERVGVGIGTAVTLGSAPVFAGVLQSALRRRGPGLGWTLGTALAIVGGVLLVQGPDATRGGDTLGLALCLASGLSYAVYSLVNKRLVDTVPASTFTLAAFGVAALIAVAFAWLGSGAPSPSRGDVAGVAYTGVVTAGIAYLLFSRALLHIGAATAVTLALMEPLVAFGLAVAVLGEPAGAASLAGLACGVGGVLIVVRSELRRADVAPLPEAQPVAAQDGYGEGASTTPSRTRSSISSSS